MIFINTDHYCLIDWCQKYMAPVSRIRSTFVKQKIIRLKDVKETIAYRSS